MATETGNKLSLVQAHRSAPQPADLELSAAARALMASIEESLRPKELAAAFPRIVNRMASLWRSPRQMDSYFDELLTDTRGGRQGFPLAILMELTSLKDHYQTQVFPPTQQLQDVWAAAETAAKRKA
jgi:hypothetical protein